MAISEEIPKRQFTKQNVQFKPLRWHAPNIQQPLLAVYPAIVYVP